MPVIYLDGVLDREAVVTRGKAFTAEVRGLTAVPATVRGNRFGPRHRYGYLARYGTQPADDACTGNVDADGRPVTARQL